MCCLLHKDLRVAQLPVIQGVDQPPMSSPRQMKPGLVAVQRNMSAKIRSSIIFCCM